MYTVENNLDKVNEQTNSMIIYQPILTANRAEYPPILTIVQDDKLHKKFIRELIMFITTKFLNDNT
jgi:hypothetical protein